MYIDNGNITIIKLHWKLYEDREIEIKICGKNQKTKVEYLGTHLLQLSNATFENSNFRPRKRLINAKKLGNDSLMFLVHPTLSKDEIHQTCNIIILMLTMIITTIVIAHVIIIS